MHRSNAPLMSPLLGVALTILGATVYLVTMSRGPFPGESARLIASYTGLLPMLPTGQPVWHLLALLGRAIPGVGPDTLLNVVSALLGGVSVGLTYAVVRRLIRYTLHDNMHFAANADRTGMLGGVCAALFLAFSSAFWTVSTRAHTLSLGITLLLGVAWLLLRFTETGHTVFLYALCALLGLAAVEFATVLLFVPIFAFWTFYLLWQRDLIRTGIIARGTAWLLFGLSAYLWGAWLISSTEAYELSQHESYWDVLVYTWRNQYLLLARSLPRVGWLLVVLMTVVPWAASMILMKRGLSGEWDWGFGLLHIVLTVISIGMLFNIPIMPWPMFGQSNLLVTPYLLGAVVYGYVICYWFQLAQWRQIRAETDPSRRRASVACGAIAIAGLVVSIIPLFRNYADTNARGAGHVNALVHEIINDLSDDACLVTDGVLDANLVIAASRLGRDDVKVVNLFGGRSAPYVQHVLNILESPTLAGLGDVGVGPILKEWIRGHPEDMRRAVVMPVSDIWEGSGHVAVPDRFGFVGSNSADLNITSVEESERFWTAVVPGLQDLAAGGNDMLTAIGAHYLRHLSLIANDLGVAMEDQGDDGRAFALYDRALAILPDNVSAKLNQYTMIEQGRHEGSADEYRQRLDAVVERAGKRTVWALAHTYGYVRAPAASIDLGMVWAASGRRSAALREFNRSRSVQFEAPPAARAALADVYLKQFDLDTSQDLYRSVLDEQPQNLHALLGMSRIASARGEIDEARTWAGKAADAGAPESAILLESALLALQQRELSDGRALLESLVLQAPADPTAWALLSDTVSRLNDQEALARCKQSMLRLESKNYLVYAALGAIASGEKDIKQAIAFYESSLARKPSSVSIIRRLAVLHLADGQESKAMQYVRILINRDSGDSFGNWMLARLQVERGELEMAESTLKRCMTRHPHPVIMNDLAVLLLEQARFEEAERVLKDGLQRWPGLYLGWSNLARVLMASDRDQEALVAFRNSLQINASDPRVHVHAVELFIKLGEDEKARGMLKVLRGKQDSLPDDYKSRLDALLTAMSSGTEAS
ncbi:MAG: DUF2723 domain-containing protein [Verrucomicrobia bacterium]|nr:DUF2723 domain-containing protein [Verrucomicrobiota bacterium]